MIGPFDRSPFSLFRINPTRKYSRKKRLIIDLSAPHDNVQVPSINSLIPLPNFSLFYASVDNAIQFIKAKPTLSMLLKLCRFTRLNGRPTSSEFNGVKKIFFSIRLTFGCCSSPRIFDTLSEVLCWILLNDCKLPFVLNFLDNFFSRGLSKF